MQQNDPLSIRNQAVKAHNDNVNYFVKEYQKSDVDPYGTAFTYGRKKMDELLFELLAKIPKSGRILDVGCGTGEQIKQFRTQGFQVEAIEPAPEMREFAIRNNPGVSIADAVATALPFDNARFDLVIAIEVLRYLHADDIKKSYEEMLRVTKPGGTIFFTMVNRYALDGYFFWHKAHALFLKLGGKPRKSHCEFLTPRQIKSLFGNNDAASVAVHGRMLAMLRFAYKLHPKFGSLAARALEPVDNFLAHFNWATPFAGHLIVVVIR
jgi:SAM-dependent methyltransferase